MAKPPRFTDFSELIKTGFRREQPTLCEALPGRCLFYRGRINSMHGEPSTGKTNIALAVADQIMTDGGRVLYLDPEDNPAGIGQRFLGLGGSPENLVARFHYVHNPEPDEMPGLVEWAKSNGPAAVVFDGLAEFLASEGLSEDKPADVLFYFRQRVRPFADAGAMTLVSDHVVKNAEARGRWPRGSGAKMGRYDGAVYELRLGKSYSPGAEGFVRFIVAKDRCGGVGAMGHEPCGIHFLPGGDGRTVVEFREPAGGGAGGFRPTGLMEKISRFLENSAGGASKNGVENGVPGKGEFKRMALALLVEGGFVRVEKQGRADIHHSVKPYREGDQE